MAEHKRETISEEFCQFIGSQSHLQLMLLLVIVVLGIGGPLGIIIGLIL